MRRSGLSQSRRQNEGRNNVGGNSGGNQRMNAYRTGNINSLGGPRRRLGYNQRGVKYHKFIWACLLGCDAKIKANLQGR